jgi:hypothetical protein
VLRPVVNYEPFDRVGVQPTSRQKGLYHPIFIAAIVYRECNIFVGKFPEVATRTLTTGDVPN